MIKEIFLSCALSLSSVVAWRPPLTDADKAFHQFIVAMTPSGTADDILFIPKPWKRSEVILKLWNLTPGGFVFIEGRLFQLKPWFDSHGWQRLPMTWRKFHIWRKPGGLNLHAA